MAVEKSLGNSESFLAISLVKTRLIPRSENKDINPNMERAAEYMPKLLAPIFPAKKNA